MMPVVVARGGDSDGWIRVVVILDKSGIVLVLGATHASARVVCLSIRNRGSIAEGTLGRPLLLRNSSSPTQTLGGAQSRRHVPVGIT